MNCSGLIFALLLWFGIGGFSGAHQVETVELEFLQLSDEWWLEGEMDIAYMLPETRNVPGGPPMSRKAVMAAPLQELERIRRETEKTLRGILRITFAGKNVEWRIDFPDFEKTPFRLPEEDMDWALLSTRLVIDARPGPGDLEMYWSGEEESELIILVDGGDDPRIVSVPPGGRIVLLEVAASGDTSVAKQSVTGGWVMSGFRHVVPLGLDHMLFILGLFLLVPKWKPLMGQSLLFTLAHSVSLGLAVFGWVNLNGRLVEILIAFSIAFIGVENLFVHKLGKRRLLLVAGFGLLHGLGFASVLANKVRNVPSDELAEPLLGFNVGVELAQISVLAAAFLILWPLKKWTRQVQVIGSVVVALAGITWMIERILSR